MGAILKIVGLVASLFTAGSTVTERAASGFNGIALIGGIVGILAWLFGPGKEFFVTLNALEMGFILLAGFVAGEILRRMEPLKP